MSVGLLHREGVLVPVLLCEICEGHIQGLVGVAISRPSSDYQANSTTFVWHVHDGACLTEAERVIRDTYGAGVVVVQLRRHLFSLLINQGVTPQSYHALYREAGGE